MLPTPIQAHFGFFIDGILVGVNYRFVYVVEKGSPKYAELLAAGYECQYDDQTATPLKMLKNFIDEEEELAKLQALIEIPPNQEGYIETRPWML
jgi:hypothetical protein